MEIPSVKVIGHTSCTIERCACGCGLDGGGGGGGGGSDSGGGESSDISSSYATSKCLQSLRSSSSCYRSGSVGSATVGSVYQSNFCLES